MHALGRFEVHLGVSVQVIPESKTPDAAFPRA